MSDKRTPLFLLVWLSLAAALASGCLPELRPASDRPGTVVGVQTRGAEQITPRTQEGLRISLMPLGSRTMRPNQSQQFSWAIHNDGQEDRTYLQSGPGGNPDLYFVAEFQQPDGTWLREPRGGGGCGFLWQPQPPVSTGLEARTAQPLPDAPSFWHPRPEYSQGPGRVRVFGVYRAKVDGYVEAQAPWFPETDLELVSEPVEFAIERPLELRVAVKRPSSLSIWRRGAGLARFLIVEVVNVSDRPQTVAAANRETLRVWIRFDGSESRLEPRLPETLRRSEVLAPGESLVLLDEAHDVQIPISRRSTRETMREFLLTGEILLEYEPDAVGRVTRSGWISLGAEP